MGALIQLTGRTMLARSLEQTVAMLERDEAKG